MGDVLLLPAPRGYKVDYTRAVSLRYDATTDTNPPEKRRDALVSVLEHYGCPVEAALRISLVLIASGRFDAHIVTHAFHDMQRPADRVMQRACGVSIWDPVKDRWL